MRKLLIIDDDKEICTLLSRYLQRQGFGTDIAHTGHDGIEKFREHTFDAVLCDFRLGDKDGLEVVRAIRAIDQKMAIIIVTGYSDIRTAVEIIKEGAFDYVVKPIIPDELLTVINKALDIETEARKDKKTKGPKGIFEDDHFLTGTDPSTKDLYKQIELVAPTNYSVILYGESGTGKEVVARSIHQKSARKHMPFVAMDCGTLSRELSGSELFGHVKGSFTGAIADKEGHFELANGGTLFLDEVANLSAEVQASLLRVVQERKFKKVGGLEVKDIDVRIIVASHEDLSMCYKKGKFREDLFHRFNEFTISLPALRDRKNDIPLFAEYFLKNANEELNRQKKVEGFDPAVMEIFLHYPWPGNLRELKNVIRRASLLTGSAHIETKSLPAEIINYLSIDKNPLDNKNVDRLKTPDLKGVSMNAQYDTIFDVLKETNFNKTKAAEKLNIDRKTLYNKIKDHDNKEKENS